MDFHSPTHFSRNRAGLVRAAIDAVDYGDEDVIAFIEILPNNLGEKIQVK